MLEKLAICWPLNDCISYTIWSICIDISLSSEPLGKTFLNSSLALLSVSSKQRYRGKPLPFSPRPLMVGSARYGQDLSLWWSVPTRNRKERHTVKGLRSYSRGHFLQICKVNEQLPLVPLALEDQPSVLEGHRHKRESVSFRPNREQMWALAWKWHGLRRPTGTSGPQLAPCLFCQSRVMNENATARYRWKSPSSSLLVSSQGIFVVSVDPQTPKKQRLPSSHQDNPEKTGVLSL